MATNTAFNIISLDFAENKESLRSFLSSQDTLKDYNFDGSVLDTLLDVLSYNTHYQAFYANMIANEMFMDSALLRPSVVSHAKALGYVPSSVRSASAVLDIDISSVASESTYLARGSEFTGKDGDGTPYRFVNLNTVYANTATNQFVGVKIYEGTLRRVSYIYDTSMRQSTYLLIPNDKVDITTIRVRVQKSTTDGQGSGDLWTFADSYIDLTPTSKVYFLQEREAGLYEVFFGDGFLGKQPDTGNVIVIEYLESNGQLANGISSFSTSISGLGGISASVSAGGADQESVSTIKFLAPKYYSSQNRAVTEDDYSAVVYKEYPNAASVMVYGGESVTPPQYGKVFLAVKPKSGSVLTRDEKETLVRKIKQDRSVVTITPEIVDPDYIDVLFDSLVTYDPAVAAVGEGTLKALVVAYMFAFSSGSLEAFGSNLYLSKLKQGINGVNSSILSNETTVSLRKMINLSKLIASKGFTIDFKNPIYHPHDGHSSSVITSSIISHNNTDGVLVSNVRAEDDGYGKINLVTIDSMGMKTLVYPNIGTVDYEKGIINFSTSFVPVTDSEIFTITVKPMNSDIYVFENKILRVSRGYSDSVKVSVKSYTARMNNLKG